MSADPCLHCDHPETGHGIRYAALVGDHEHVPSHEPAPRPIPHPLGGVTYPVDSGDPDGLRMWMDHTDPAPAEYPGDRLHHYGRHIA
jgi:hypothetical protein